MSAVSAALGGKRIVHANHGPREGRLLALFRSRTAATAAASVGSALRREGAHGVRIEVELVDGMEAVRATWPIETQDLANPLWLHRVVQHIAPDEGDQVRANLGTTRRLAIFVSKTSHCLADLLQRNFSGTLPCEVACVISNNEACRPLAELYGVPFYFFDTTLRTKESIEAEQLAMLAAHDVNLVVLARYMRILSPTFVDQYASRIINIHHSLLPAFVGADPYQQAIDRGVKVFGVTAHYVTAELDAGPIIEQQPGHASHGDNAASLRARGAELEAIVLARAVRLHLEDRLLPVNGRVVVFDGRTVRHGTVDDAPEAAEQWLPTGWDWHTTLYPLIELQRVPDGARIETVTSGENVQ